jgi:hypothetical protein
MHVLLFYGKFLFSVELIRFLVVFYSKDHIKYDEHQCPSYRKNVQIPVCPLCNQAVSSANRDLSPNRVVSAHIDRDCKSDPALKKLEKFY